jgi:hypothetical protein
MPEIATGTFTPLHEIKPDPDESDWIPPDDLNVADVGVPDHSVERGGPGLASAPTGQPVNHPDRQDRISRALDTILGELEGEVGRLNAEGAQLFGQSKYDEAATRAEEGKRLQGFREKFSNLRAEWLSLGTHSGSRASPNPQLGPKGIGNERTPTVRKKFSVVFGDGEKIMEDTAAATFAKCIARIGVEKVKALDLRFNGRPLLLDEPGKDRWKADGYYFDTRTDAAQKRKLLQAISEGTGVPLEVVTSQ